MKKFAHILFISFTLLTQISFAQTVNVPLKHWVYDFIDRLETKGIFYQLSTKSYPLSRTEISLILAKIEHNKKTLSSTELALFDQLKGEFHEELEQLNIKSDPLYFERHLMSWSEGVHKAKVDFDFAEVFDVKRGDQYQTADRTSHMTMGGIIRGRFGQHFNFYIHAQNTLNRGSEISNESFDPRYGTPIVISGKNVYSDEAWAYLTWDHAWFQLEFGRDQIKWGPGRHGSLMISKENPLFEMLKLKFKFSRFQFTSFHGSLHSGIGAKYLAGHRLELKAFPWLYISGSEAVIYGNRNVELSYLNPLMPYHVAEHHLGDKDNNSMAFDMTCFPLKNHKFYFELFLDDFTTAENPFTYYGNKFAFLLGYRWISPFGLTDADINWEYTRIEPYVYTHKDSINTFQNYDKSIGHWLGPNSDDLFIELRYLFNRDLKLSLSAERIRHGEGDINTPHRASDGTRKRFLSGTVETKWSFGFNFTDQLFRDVFLSLNYYYMKTDNLNRIEGAKSKDSQASFQLSLNW